MQIEKANLNGPKYDLEPITTDQLSGEFEFLTAQRFLNSMLASGRITHDEFDKALRKLRDKFSPLYPEVRA